MGDDFKLPPGDTFPPRSMDTERPRRRSIDTPALKLDTSVSVTVKPVDLHVFPPTQNGKSQDSFKTISKPVKQSLTTVASQPAQIIIQTQDGPSEDTTPVMRSMFPRFDPAVRLSQQPYIPTIERSLPASVAQPLAPHYSPSLYSQPRSPPMAVIAGDPWAASRVHSTYIQRSPSRAVDNTTQAQLSTAEELLDLWAIALGQDSPEALHEYKLGVKCNSLRHNHESLSFISSTSELYIANAAGTTVTISRKHPLSSATGVTVATPNFELPSTTSPTLAAILPSLAESLAVDTAKKIASDNMLSSNDAANLQKEAVLRIKRTEAGSLLWDSDSSRYYFTVPLSKSLESAGGSSIALPIEYIPNASIRFLNGSSQPLLALDLENYMLTLDTVNIMSLSHSTYTLDILLSALLVLTIHIHRSGGLFTEPTLVAPHFEPPPGSVRGARGRSSRVSRKQGAHLSTPWLSRLNPLSRSQSRLTQISSPSPSPYLTNQNASTLAFDKDIELASEIGSTIILPHHIPPMTAPPIPSSGIAPELRASNTGVDLSKFQAFDLEDPELGNGTKVVLRLLYWLFSVIVWVLGVGVGVLAAGIVAVGGCFGSGKGSREG